MAKRHFGLFARRFRTRAAPVPTPSAAAPSAAPGPFLEVTQYNWNYRKFFLTLLAVGTTAIGVNQGLYKALNKPIHMKIEAVIILMNANNNIVKKEIATLMNDMTTLKNDMTVMNANLHRMARKIDDLGDSIGKKTSWFFF